MAQALAKSQIAAEIATKNSLTQKQAVEILESIVRWLTRTPKIPLLFPASASWC
ncbi:MAG: hypothetical protein WCS42_20935 [Verrucomicrobiota bacterium]